MRVHTLIILLFAGVAGGDLVTIEADNFPQGTNISEHFEGISLHAFNIFDVEYFDLYAVDYDNYLQLMGDNVLGYYDPWYPLGRQDYWASDPVLRIDFHNIRPIRVTVEVLSKYGAYPQHTFADGYTADGTRVVQGYITRPDESEVTILESINPAAYDITYYQFWSGNNVFWDQITIEYEVIPEPGTMLLLLVGFAIFRRRQYA